MTSTASFQQFLRRQRANNGIFRYCVDPCVFDNMKRQNADDTG